jgi:hypothetical protein
MKMSMVIGEKEELAKKAYEANKEYLSKFSTEIYDGSLGKFVIVQDALYMTIYKEQMKRLGK